MRVRMNLEALEARDCPSFNHYEYALGLYAQMPHVIHETVTLAGGDYLRDIRPIWNERLTDNAELEFLRGTSADYADGLMVRSPWTGHLTVYYRVNAAGTPGQVEAIVSHEILHWFDYSYAQAYYGQRASASAQWDSIWEAHGRPWGYRDEAWVIYGACWLDRSDSYGTVPDYDNYFSALYGPPNVIGT